MKRAILPALLALGLMGCARTENAAERAADRTEDAAERTGEAAREAARDTRTAVNRTEYEAETERRLNDWDREWDEFKRDTKNTANRAVNSDEVETARREARQAYEKMKNASADAWEDTKRGFDGAMDRLERAWNRGKNEVRDEAREADRR
jgi:hypothetical protein